MAELKLPKLPERTPFKLSVTVSPELKQALEQYANAYEVAYGQREAVPDLIPFMLQAFLDSDRTFSRARKEKSPAVKRDG